MHQANPLMGAFPMMKPGDVDELVLNKLADLTMAAFNLSGITFDR